MIKTKQEMCGADWSKALGMIKKHLLQVGQQTEPLAGEVNLNFSGSKQMSMEVGQDWSGENVSLLFCLQIDIVDK